MKTVIKHEGVQTMALLDDNGLESIFRYDEPLMEAYMITRAKANLHRNALVVKALITESQLERIRCMDDPIKAAKLFEARASYMETESPKTWEALKWRT